MVTAGLVREHAEAIAEGLADEVRESYPTKLDFEHGFEGFRAELQEFKAEVRAELQEFRAELRTGRAEVGSEIQSVRAEIRTIEAGMHKDNQTFRAEIRQELAEMHKPMRDLARRMTGLLLAQGAAVVALIRFVP